MFIIDWIVAAGKALSIYKTLAGLISKKKFLYC